MRENGCITGLALTKRGGKRGLRSGAGLEDGQAACRLASFANFWLRYTPRAFLKLPGLLWKSFRMAGN